jgi:hypothetical protein
MRKAFLAASALTLALSASAWAQSTPSAGSSGMHKPAPTGLVEQNPTAGGPTVDRATSQTGVNASAGSSTPAAGSTGASTPARNQTAGLPPVAAGLPQNQYVLQMGERMRQWFPVVDTYLDSAVPPGRVPNQVSVKTAWERARAEWDALQSADATAWNARRSEFEAAYTGFERAWDEAQRNSG